MKDLDLDDEGEFSWAETLSDRDVAKQSDMRPPDSLRASTGLADIKMLLYTSGTTGLPKAPIVSFMNLRGGPFVFLHLLGMKRSDRLYTCMPLYHSTGLILGAEVVIVSGASLVLGHKFSRQSIWNEIRQSQSTCFQYVGEMCRYLLSSLPSPEDTSHHVRLAFGNGMRPDVWNKFRNLFAVSVIAEFYGATSLPTSLY